MHCSTNISGVSQDLLSSVFPLNKVLIPAIVSETRSIEDSRLSHPLGGYAIITRTSQSKTGDVHSGRISGGCQLLRFHHSSQGRLADYCAYRVCLAIPTATWPDRPTSATLKHQHSPNTEPPCSLGNAACLHPQPWPPCGIFLHPEPNSKCQLLSNYCNDCGLRSRS